MSNPNYLNLTLLEDNKQKKTMRTRQMRMQ